MRVYLPTTLLALPGILRDSSLGPAPLAAFAVTPALWEAYASGDLEELEYVAMTHAARACLRLLAAAPGAPRRRVVLAADVADEHVVAVAGFDEPTLVTLSAAVPLSRVASGHVNDPVAVPDVEAAVAALTGADAGDPDAQFLVNSAEGHDLLWYATQELPCLLT